MWYIIIYFIGLILNPILMVYLDKRFPKCMDIQYSFDFGPAMFFGAFFWPLMLFVEGFLLLRYWHNH